MVPVARRKCAEAATHNSRQSLPPWEKVRVDPDTVWQVYEKVQTCLLHTDEEAVEAWRRRFSGG
jgi:hypothetical protein